MKTILQLLVGVIIFVTQSDVIMIVDMQSAEFNGTQPGVASAQIADNRLQLTSAHLSQIQALLGNALPAQQPMPRISPISVPITKRGPVK